MQSELAAIPRGIAKVNVGTEIRQPYEQTVRETGDVVAAQEAVYERTTWVLRDYLKVAGKRGELLAGLE